MHDKTIKKNRPVCRGFETDMSGGRRQFLNSFGMGLGAMALSQWLPKSRVHAGNAHPADAIERSRCHHLPRAKRVIFLFQAGAPSQIDLFDHKPVLRQRHGEQLPDSVRQGQRLTGMSGHQSNLPLVGSPFHFSQHGESGSWVSDLMPHTARIVDDLCWVKSMHTEAINHGPAVTFIQTGSQFPGRPSMGAWLSYGLGSQSSDLPGFVVLITKNKGGQPLASRQWGAGFLPSRFQGVRFRSGKDPVLYLNNPQGIDAAARRQMLDTLSRLNAMQLEEGPDPEIETRIAQYELGYRMQTSIPDVVDMADEPANVFDAYGPDSKNPGTFAANCLLARRLAERGVRFIQLYHQGWDQHGDLPNAIRRQCRETDQPSAALVADLKQRGMLDDTLVVWGGEFGRTNYCQGKLTAKNFGRDHHPRCFTIWMAGGGTRSGSTYGRTDEFGYNTTEDPVHIHDFQATLLHLLGIDHERLVFQHQGRRYRLTDVHGNVVRDLLA